jgi:hypothetical protein
MLSVLIQAVMMMLLLRTVTFIELKNIRLSFQELNEVGPSASGGRCLATHEIQRKVEKTTKDVV